MIGKAAMTKIIRDSFEVPLDDAVEIVNLFWKRAETLSEASLIRQEREKQMNKLWDAELDARDAVLAAVNQGDYDEAARMNKEYERCRGWRLDYMLRMGEHDA